MFEGGFPSGRQRLAVATFERPVLVLLDESLQWANQISGIERALQRSVGVRAPGSVYPILQQLEDEGLVEISSTVSGKTYNLTATGKALVEKDRATLGKPWETAAADVSDATSDLFGTLRQVVLSVAKSRWPVQTRRPKRRRPSWPTLGGRSTPPGRRRVLDSKPAPSSFIVEGAGFRHS